MEDPIKIDETPMLVSDFMYVCVRKMRRAF